ncbi:MAG: outer membrane beta-barrel protein [Methylococcales bacterium]|nr:outer membrane beta-barrel protein [Methylococcales bacterium]
MYKRKLLVLIISLCTVNTSWATDRKIVDRQTAQYLQQGKYIGSFILLPSFDIAETYNSNIFYTDKINKSNPPKSSYATHYKPGIALQSDWNRHSLGFKFDADIAQYVTLPDQTNYNDFHTLLKSKLDVVRDSYFDGTIAYNSIHENRFSPDQTLGKGPTLYDNAFVDAFYTHKFNRISLNTGINATDFSYQDVPTDGGEPLKMSSRNHREYLPSVRVGYEIQPGYEAFVKFLYKQAQYDTKVFTNGLGTAYDRNSTGYNFLGGMAFDLTDLLSADISFGYLQRSYVDPQLKNISGINGFINLKWRPTMLTTISGKLSRDINETTQSGVSGVLATGFGLDIDHELLRNVHLMAGGSFSNNGYQGYVVGSSNQKNRVDNMLSFNVGAKYMLNRYFSSDISYNYQNRDTNYKGSGYQGDTIMLNIRGQY